MSSRRQRPMNKKVTKVNEYIRKPWEKAFSVHEEPVEYGVLMLSPQLT